MSEKNLTAQALKLPRKKRAALAQKIIDSLEDEKVMEEFIEEAERRWEAYKRGEIKAIPAEAIVPGLGRKRLRS